MRFPHRARSRRLNPEPASLIAPVVSSNSPCVLVSTSFENRSKVFPPTGIYGRKALFFRSSGRFSPRKLRTLSNAPRPFTVERRDDESRVFRSVRENASGRVACAPRARASTHADERDARTSAPRRFSRDTPRLYFSPTCPPTNRSRPSLPVVAETPRGPRGGSRRRRARPRTPRARSWWPPRRSPPARSRSARRAGCTTPTAPRWGRCTGTRGVRVASDTSVFVRSADALLFEKKTRNANASLPARPARAPSWAWARSAASPRSGTPPASASGGRRGSSRAASAASARSAAPCTAAKFDAACARRETKRRTRETRRTRTTNDERGVRIRPASV